MSRIKTRETHKNIKALDKAAVATERMKDSFVRSKEKAAQLSEDGQGSPSEYAGDKVQRAEEDGARDAAYVAVEQGKKQAVKGREAIRARSEEAPPEADRHFFGTTPEEPGPSYDPQVERARLYAKQTAQTRAVDPQRQPKTLENSVGRQPTIKMPNAVHAERDTTLSEEGRQYAERQARNKAKGAQLARGKDYEALEAGHSIPHRSASKLLETTEADPIEQGRQIAVNRAKIKAKEALIARNRESAAEACVEKPSNFSAYLADRYRGSFPSGGVSQRQIPQDTVHIRRSRQEAVKTIRQRDRSLKRFQRNLRRGQGRIVGSRRFTQKQIKTAEQVSKASIKTAQISVIRGRKTVQTAAVTAQRSAHAARAAKVAAATTAKAVTKATREMAKTIAIAAKSLFAAISAGGTVAVTVIVLIGLIGLIAGSCFGVLFAAEDSGTGLTMQSAVLQINGELSDRIEKVKAEYEGEYDKVELINANGITNWPDVIAVYAVKTTTDKDSPDEVATMTQEKIDKLRAVCWDMNPITAKLVEGEESTVLQITVTAKSYTDMIDEYNFDEDQKKMVTELMNSCLLDKYKNLTTPAEAEGDFPTIEGTGGYIWPLNGYTRISSPFGYRICPFHGRELHGGCDIPAPYGTPVHAAKSGTVVKSTYGSSYGNHIVIAHGDGTRTLYAHMSARMVSVGQTVSQGQTIEFDASLLKELLLPGKHESVSVEDVINKIVSVRTERETAKRRYFQVELDGVWEEAGLVDPDTVEDYLLQHAPLLFSKEFKWGRTITEKMRLSGYEIPKYKIRLNGETLYKPYRDTLISDRVKKQFDLIRDIKVETFYRKDNLSAILWYAETSFYGTIIDNTIKGLRIRQGNILIGGKGSCSSLFKEERFNGWMIGELHVIDPEIIVNSRRDGFEKNSAYYELLANLKDWAFEDSKEIRHLSYERSLSSPKKVVAEAEQLDDIADENDLYSEDLAYAEDYGESATIDQDESTELAETDYISKLGLLLNQKKAQTKYTALNINSKLTIEQRRVLERVFDLITQEYDNDVAEMFVNTIATKF